jgi:psp operon transcriptional activator
MNTFQNEALGESNSFLEYQEKLSRVAPIDRPVLIIGERGTGKELAAQRLHYLSPRWDKPFITVNCAALSESLLESELFGHEAGSFTGAQKRREGRFEAADGGTLFLDEIGQAPMIVQEKILRIVEYQQFERVGSSHPIEVNVRILGATNANLPQMAKEGKFKKDLLDRLSFEVLTLPPLRDRQSDILLLANKFVSQLSIELEWESIPQFSAFAKNQLLQYNWPGNIRELKNVVERSAYRAEGKTIKEIIIDPFGNNTSQVDISVVKETASVSDSGSKSPRIASRIASRGTLQEEVAIYEQELLQSALKENNFHQGKAAKKLGLTYNQFRNLLRKHKANLDL